MSLSRRSWLAATISACMAVPAAAQSVSAAPALRTRRIAQGLDHPWSLAFLPQQGGQTQTLLVTERPGRLRAVSMEGTISPPIQGLPEVDALGQGGLLDVALDPEFSRNHLIYWSYAQAGAGGNSTAVARGELSADLRRVTSVQVIFSQIPKVSSGHHFGSRLAFARDGRLFITLGERNSRRQDAQNLGNTLGKIVRIERDGTIPPDNPFVDHAGARPEIWSYGHRNVQGAGIHPTTGELWVSEQGPQGGDEINRIVRGGNYGWPIVTYGREYVTGLRIGEGTEKAGMQSPLTYWVPSIACCGMAFYTSDRIPAWRGNLFVAALADRSLVRLVLEENRIVHEERLLRDVGARLRDVRQGPDGWLYVLTDAADGQLLRVETAS